MLHKFSGQLFRQPKGRKMTNPNLEKTTKMLGQVISDALSSFPNIISTVNKDDPVEISITVPVQQGIKYKIWITLQNNDELTFSVDRYWYQWFPCTKPEKVETFKDAISGFISGKYRILVHNKGRFHVGSELQKPSPAGWVSVASSWTPCGLIFWMKTKQNEIRNI